MHRRLDELADKVIGPVPRERCLGGGCPDLVSNPELMREMIEREEETAREAGARQRGAEWEAGDDDADMRTAARAAARGGRAGTRIRDPKFGDIIVHDQPRRFAG
jgi:hypothetical protein